METTTHESRFIKRVRSEMSSQKLSIRALARRMDPANIDRARRNLHRWLDEGIAPGRTSRQEVAVALAIDARELEPDDEEEDHLVAFASVRDLTIGDVLMAVAALKKQRPHAHPGTERVRASTQGE